MICINYINALFKSRTSHPLFRFEVLEMNACFDWLLNERDFFYAPSNRNMNLIGHWTVISVLTSQLTVHNKEAHNAQF